MLTDVLASVMDDPNVTLRWRDPETGVWPLEHAKAVDSWLKHAFRRAKTRVNKLSM
jgi:hypothetical protein